MSVKNYDPKQVAVIVGVQPAQGFADGEFITVERDEDAFSMLVGADGETTRAKNANKAGKFTLRLLQSSSTNDFLSAQMLADEISGQATFPMLVKDNFGTSLHSAATCWIAKAPAAAYGKEAGTREWVIQTDELINFVGGSTK